MNNIQNNEIPKDGIEGLKQYWSTDALSGFMVSLLALPLSLGIAKASDFPNPMYGVLTAIIGGVLVSVLAGSRLTIKGPAAGLIVIVAGAIASFGGGEMGWHMALGAIVVASVFQILFGVLKLGKLSDLFPLSAVHGMLAAIGIIIMSKQLHILLGVNPTHPVLDPTTGAAMLDAAGQAIKKPVVEPLTLLAELPKTFATMGERMPVVITGLVCLALVFGVPMLPFKWLKKIPVPIIVLAVAIPLGSYLGLSDIKGALLSFDKPFSQIVGWNVDFGGFSQNIGKFIQYVILFALIGSLESLLTVKAIDMLDPFHRKSDYNRDLIAVGAGNLLAGILGGLPMISEVARSSANVNNGAKTRWANFFHGLFLLIFMLALMPVLKMIPNAALAAMLIGVGFKLAHPKEFVHMFHIGKEQLAIFLVTIFFTLFEDLLVGILAGILLKMIIHLVNGAPFSALFKAPISVSMDEDNNHYVKVNDAAVFTNWIGVKSKLSELGGGTNITLDLADTKLVDHTVMENLKHFQHDHEAGGGKFNIIGLDKHKPFSEHELAGRKK